jgi:hypothetical protein
MSGITQKEFDELKALVQGMSVQVKNFMEAAESKNSTPTPKEGKADDLQENVPITQLSMLTNDINDLRQQNQELQLRIAKSDRAAEYKEIEGFVDMQVRERRVLPKERDAKIALLKAVPNEETMSFAGVDGRNYKKSSRQVLMETIAGGPQLWSEGQFPTGFDFEVDPTALHRYSQFQELGADHESILLDKKIRDFATSRGKNPDDPDDYMDAYTTYTRAANIVQ